MKTVLITGANRGLGYEVARQLSARGWKVIVTARRREQGAAAAAKLKNTSFLELDITDDASVARAAKAVPELDVLINNAAIIEDGDQNILTIRPELVGRTLATNALGTLRVTQAFVPHLLKGSASLIAAIESGTGVAIVPKSFSCSAGPRLKLIPLSPTPEPIVIGGVWPKHGPSPAAEKFWKAAKEAVLTTK